MAKKAQPTVTELLEEVSIALTEAMSEGEKFDRGNKAAGGRLRKIIAQIPKKLKIVKAVSLGKDV
jgi:hypothetical protein